jgi:hypothetical protein
MGAILRQLVDSMRPVHWTALAVILAVVFFRIAMEELLRTRPGRAVARLARRPAGRRSLPTRAARQVRSRPRAVAFLAKRTMQQHFATVARDRQQQN